MDRSAWERLGDELRAQDRWGDFEVAKSHPKAKEWPQIGDHPVNLIVNGCVSGDHFESYAPILVRALDELTVDSGLEMVVRALTRKGMTIAVDRVLKLFTDDRYVEDHRFLWAVGNAIYHISPRDHLEECIDICRQRKLGYSRHRLIVHLSRFKKSEEVFQTLLGLLEDESVRGAALEALRRYGDVRATAAIERTPVRDGDEGIYETHQKKMALKKLNEKSGKLKKHESCGKGRHMAKSPTRLASELLDGGAGGLEELRVHLFEDGEDDEEALDDRAMERLYSEFSAEFDQAEAALTEQYGEPSRTGKEDDEVVPLNGVIRFAIWPVGDRQLFLAFAHEDHGLPILLMLGTVDE